MLSPILFSTYIDSLLQKLKDSVLGCHVCRTFAGVFGYADDLALISPQHKDEFQKETNTELYRNNK